MKSIRNSECCYYIVRTWIFDYQCHMGYSIIEYDMEKVIDILENVFLKNLCNSKYTIDNDEDFLKVLYTDIDKQYKESCEFLYPIYIAKDIVEYQLNILTKEKETINAAEKKSCEELERLTGEKYMTPDTAIIALYEEFYSENVEETKDIIDVFKELLRYGKGMSVWLNFCRQAVNSVVLKDYRFLMMYAYDTHTVCFRGKCGTELKINLDYFKECDYYTDIDFEEFFREKVMCIHLVDFNGTDIEIQFDFSNGVYMRSDEEYLKIISVFT